MRRGRDERRGMGEEGWEMNVGGEGWEMGVGGEGWEMSVGGEGGREASGYIRRKLAMFIL